MLALALSGAQANAFALVHLTNTGDLAATIGAIAVVGGAFGQGTSTCTGSLAAGASCSIGVGFSPVALGAGLAGTITLVPSALDFGLIPLGASVPNTAMVTLENNTAATADLTAISVTGAKFSAGTSTCTRTLAPATSCTINIGFSPTALGTVSGSLTTTVNRNAITATLAGTGAESIVVGFTGTGTGTVTSTTRAIHCPSPCSVLSASPLTLIGTADTGSVFAGFVSCGSPCTVAPDATIQADFELTTNFTTRTRCSRGPIPR